MNPMTRTLNKHHLFNRLQNAGVFVCTVFLILEVCIEFGWLQRSLNHGPQTGQVDAAASLLAVLALAAFAILKGVELRAESNRRLAAERRLAELETQDPLTGLANRRRMLDVLGQALQARKTGGEVTGLLLIDLERFKPITDAHGGAVGDRLLQMVAERLQAVAREGETVARLGGDEFAIVLPRLTSAQAARHPAQRLVRALEAPFELDDLALRIGGARVAVATSADTELRPAALVYHVDAALHRAKGDPLIELCSRRQGSGRA
jgi:diguanylate cyclase (GGDEF)-like protein